MGYSMPFTKGHKINIGKVVSDITKQKISLKNKGKVRSEELKQRLSEIHKGKRPTTATRKKMSETHKKLSRPGDFKKGHIPWCLGLKLTPEHIKKMADSKRGMPSPRKGKTHTIESRIKMRASHLGVPMPLEVRRKISNSTRGSKSFNWRGGITKINLTIRRSLDYRLWRTAVFERDNYTCIWCGNNKGGNLEADHIKPFAYYPSLRFELSNGRTLCKSCHRKTDTWGNLAGVNQYTSS